MISGYLPKSGLLSEQVQSFLPESYVGVEAGVYAVSFFNQNMTADIVLSPKLTSNSLQDLYNGVRESFPELDMHEHQFWTYFADSEISAEDIYFIAVMSMKFGNLINNGYWNQLKKFINSIRISEADMSALPEEQELEEAIDFQREMRDEGVFLFIYDICIFKRVCKNEDIIRLLAESVTAAEVEQYAKMGFTDYDSIVNTAMRLPKDWVNRIFNSKEEDIK